MANGQAVGQSSYGKAVGGADPFNQGFAPSRAILDTARFRELNRRQQYLENRQHDGKLYDFDGRSISKATGAGATQPMISQEKVPFFVPMRNRRPSSPYRLGPIIVGAFTNLLFGKNRFPQLRVEGDDARRDFTQATSRLAGLPVKMIRARTLGGGMGSVGMSWSFVNGRPRIEVHNAKNIFVHEWADRSALVPAWATECYLFEKEEWDATKRAWAMNWFWYRRDWTLDEDIVFAPVRFDKSVEIPNWTVEKSVAHGEGACHFHWCQNLPNDEDIDGLPDYDGLYETCDTLDILYSVLARGGVLNLDPTLKLKMDPELVARGAVKKGSDNAIVTGKDGDAEYMELAGTSIEAGLKLFESKRRSALETAQCIVPDPSEIAANGVSSVTIETLFEPMLGKAAVLREQYGALIVRMLDQINSVATRMIGTRVTVTQDDGSEEEQEVRLNYPPRFERAPVLDDNGLPTGEETVTVVERSPGESGEVELQWPSFFSPTVDDLSKAAPALTAATGGKAFMTQQTATRYMASLVGHDPEAEWKAMQAGLAEEETKTAAMLGDVDDAAAGSVTHTQELPSGATISRSVDIGAKPTDTPADDEDGTKPKGGKVAGGITLAPTDLATIITVNEARASINLPPLPGPDGDLTMAEFKAKNAKTVASAANAELGKVGEPPPADALKTPPLELPGAPRKGPPSPGGPKLPGAPSGAPAGPLKPPAAPSLGGGLPLKKDDDA
jgi:hypothetical protein